MTIYRTDGPWGTGKGSNLTPAEVDGNFWELVQDVAAKAVQGVGIADVIVVGNQFTFVLTDHTLLGPYTLPTATFNFRGAWEPGTHYFVNDVITDNGATYLVLVNHVSAEHFDPNDNDGHGNNFYGLLLAQPDSALPTGGLTGMFLRKSSDVDFAMAWQDAALDDLSDVDVPSPTDGQVLTFDSTSGAWVPETPVSVLSAAWDFGFSFAAQPTGGDVIQIVPVTRTIQMEADLAGSVGWNSSPPDSDYVIEMTVNEVVEAYITVHTDGGVTFFSMHSVVFVPAGSTIKFIAPPASPAITIGATAVTVLANMVG